MARAKSSKPRPKTSQKPTARKPAARKAKTSQKPKRAKAASAATVFSGLARYAAQNTAPEMSYEVYQHFLASMDRLYGVDPLLEEIARKPEPIVLALACAVEDNTGALSRAFNQMQEDSWDFSIYSLIEAFADQAPTPDEVRWFGRFTYLLGIQSPADVPEKIYGFSPPYKFAACVEVWANEADAMLKEAIKRHKAAAKTSRRAPSSRKAAHSGRPAARRSGY